MMANDRSGYIGPFGTATVTLLAILITCFFTKLYRARMLIVDRQKKGLPVAPGHSFLWGHLLYFKSVIEALPKGAHYQYAFGDIARKHFVKEGVFYIDLWPLNGLILAVISPNVAIQATQTNETLALERPHMLRRFFKPIAGGPNLFDLPEKEWKPWRAIFSKGFGSDHILSLVPGMVKETSIYCETLRKLARKGDMFFLDPTTLRLTLDLVGRTVLNTSLGAQDGYNTLAGCMLSQIRWHQLNASTIPLRYFNFARWYMRSWNNRQMNRYIGEELDKRYNEYQADSSKSWTKSIIDLILQAYLPEDIKTKTKKLDPEFRAFATWQIRLFVFAGFDSTSSTICYIIHLLATNQKAMTRIRAEHNEVFGSDLVQVKSMLEKKPHLINSLPYTTAVIKEALRLFTPAGGTRAGKPAISIIDDQGNQCPTDDADIWIVHMEMHRAAKYWKHPDEFLPERWLAEPGNELYPMKGAWRSFEHGPRNCIAQGLVMTELRTVLALTVREFEFKPAYDEWDKLHHGKSILTYRGERAYQIEEGAAHPVDHYPCRVFLREEVK